MKKNKIVNSRIATRPDDTFERMKRVYITQIQKTDSQPQKVIFD